MSKSHLFFSALSVASCITFCLSIINSPAEFSRTAVLRPMRPFSRSISDIKAFIISPSLKTSRKERIDPFVSEDWWRSPLAPPKSIKKPYGFTAKTSPSINWPNYKLVSLETNDAFFSDRTNFLDSGFTSRKATFSVLPTKDW